MGKMILVLLVGFATSFGLLANSKNRRYIDSVDRAVNQFASYSANNASASGAYMALNRLYQDLTWRTGYNNVKLAGDTITVTLVNAGVRRLRILSNGRNANATDLTNVLILDGTFGDFAIWAKDSVTNAGTNDAFGNPDSTLLVENAPFMPEIDYSGLTADAAAQGHVQAGDFAPPPNYPNSNFYFDLATIPNVTHVKGSLKVIAGRKVYGIFVVEGDVTIDGNARVEGIIYCPNPTSTVIYGGGNPNGASVTGGIVTYGTVDGTGNHIDVTYNPKYMKAFVKDYAPTTPPIRVLSWQ